MYQAVALSRRARMGVGAFVVAAFVLLVSAPAIAVDPPFASSESASAISATGATLNGKVNPNGASVATCRFEYGTTTEYGAVAPCQPSSLGSGTFNVSVSAAVQNLEPGITFHFRLVASSVNGGTASGDRTFTTAGTPVCSNADRRVEQGILAIQLPDCMALEQVNPPKKFSQRAASPIISADGNRVAYLSLAALAETPGNIDAFAGDFYVADRGSQGWSSSPTTPPYPIIQGWGTTKLVRSFDPTLSRWLVLGSSREQFDSGIARLYRDSLGGTLGAQSPVLAPLGANSDITNVDKARLRGVSADHSRVFFTMGDPAAKYLPGDPEVTGSGRDGNVYVAGLDSNGQPSLSLMARDVNGKSWGGNCGARLGGVADDGAIWRDQGAVAPDGSDALISARASQPESGPCSEASKLRILLREETSTGVEISELIESECDREAPDPVCDTTDTDDMFQGASADQTKVYFVSGRQLADSDLDTTADLYLYDAGRPAGQRLTQVSAGEVAPGHPTIGSGAGVDGAVAISGDGSRVYFIATGVLTPALNPEGSDASEFPADPKLYVWDTDSDAIQFVGALATTDAASLWAGAGTLHNGATPVPFTGKNAFGEEIGGDGGILFFLTRAQLTGADADGNMRDAYRYDGESPSPTLSCISCRPGGPDAEPFDVEPRGNGEPELVGTGIAEAGRWVSEDGDSALFRTNEGMTEQDLNGLSNDYLWTSGELSLLPGTTITASVSGLGQLPPVLSHSGDEVAFMAYPPLLPSDGDTAPDVYVARVGGGYKFPPPEDICVGEQGCRTAPVIQPILPSPSSETTASRGNVKPPAKAPKAKTRCPKGKRKVTRKGKTQCVKVNRNKGGKK